VLSATALPAEVKRLVVLKVDGLPGWLIETMLAERDPATGKSRLPWIERVFIERGVSVRNFYSRGLSLSVPSWSVLDTGRPAPIRGNVEFDRYTLRAFDYLNFVPFYFKSAFAKTADMLGVELLDDLDIPLLADRFPFEQTHRSFQLYQRGIRWNTLKRAARGPFPLGSPRELLDEWQAGFELSRSLQDEIERDLIGALADESILYLDLFTGDFDHLAHLDNSAKAQRSVAAAIDSLVGRVWSAIEKSPLAAKTLLVLVSDHGMNTSPRAYSQGYDLVSLFRRANGGAHHVVTNRHTQSEFKLRGLYPFVHKVFTASEESPYGASAAKQYPTALLDLDGNERAAIYLRNSDLNLIHLLLLELERRDLAPEIRAAAEAACRHAIEHFAVRSRPRIDGIKPALDALRARIAEQNSGKRSTEGLQARRMKAHIDSWSTDERAYQDAITAIERLAAFEPGRTAASRLVPQRMMGEPNTIYQMQNYVVSVAAGGLQLAPDGTLDDHRSFRRIDYFNLLTGLTVRNVVQGGVGNRPVDFVAVRVAPDLLNRAIGADDCIEAAVWINGGDDRQLLILARGGPVQLKVLPVEKLRENADGRITFNRTEWRAGLPLELLEDDAFAVPAAERAGWLSQWHSERDWLRASHRAHYSNAVIGLFDHFRRSRPDGAESFHWARRELVDADLLLLAREHWNFNVRSFNPGGNHGAFFRQSTHAVLMLAGGAAAGINRGVLVEEPYDALSVVPTLLTLMGRCEPGLPGPYIQEASSIPGCTSGGLSPPAAERVYQAVAEGAF
jgi:hypothetical protein